MDQERSLSFPAQLLDALDFPMFVLDAAGRVTHANRAACLHSGETNPLGRLCRELELAGDVVCDPASPGSDDFHRVPRANATDSDVEWRCLHIPGPDVAGMRLLVGMPMERISNGPVWCSDHILQMMFENSPDEILFVDRWGRVKMVNSRVRDIFGLEPEECMGRHVTYFLRYARFSLGVLMDMFHRVLSGDVYGTPIELECVRKDGRPILVEFLANRVIYEGKVQGILTIVRDVTERRTADARLQRADDLLAAIMKAMDDAFWDWDIPTGKAYFSPRYYTMLGYVPDEFPPGYASWASLVHPEDLPKAEKLIQEHLEQRKDAYEVEFRMRAKNGEWRWILGRGKVVGVDGQGRPVRMVGTHTDITQRVQQQEERLRLQEQLAQAQKMESVGRLAGGIAHDFNNLLTGMMGNLELAQEASTREELLGHLADLRQAVGSAAALTRQLLAFSRQQVVDLRSCDVREILGETLRLLRRLIGEHIEITTDVAPDVRGVRVDPVQFQQVLINLAVNAQDAMPNGGRLRIAARTLEVQDKKPAVPAIDISGLSDGEYVLFSVQDTGTGMTDEVMQRIFDPFFTTKPAGRGTGLGLSTVYGIVRQHGGGILVQSTLGEGSCFHIALPAAEPEDARRVSPEKAEKKASSASGETLWIVEDDPAIRKAAESILKRRGYAVRTFSSGEEFLREVREDAPAADLLLTDVVMPGMSGVELARKVRERFPRLHVLFTSGYNEEILLDQGFSGFLNLLPKPYSPEELLTRIRRILDSQN